jgi:hypothetical protein
LAAPVKPARSPSTLRRMLGQSERTLATTTRVRDSLNVRLAAADDHREVARLADELAAAQRAMDAAEEAWLELAAEAEALGLDVAG